MSVGTSLLGGDIKFNIMPFYKVKTEDSIFRITMEDYFIQKFKPALNC